MNNFFNNDTYLVDEKAFTIINEYKMYDAQGVQLGVARENRTLLRIILSLFVSKKNLPFNIELTNTNGNIVSSITKSFTLFMPTLKMHDDKGFHIATIKQKFGLKPRFDILDVTGNNIGSIMGDFVAWNFSIIDSTGADVGSISKKYNGLGKELFTTADKYVVSVSPQLTDEVLRSTIITIACALDMIMKEN